MKSTNNMHIGNATNFKKVKKVFIKSDMFM